MSRAEKFWQWLAWKLPRHLVYWCAIRLMAHATGGAWSSDQVHKVTIMTALKRWGTK